MFQRLEEIPVKQEPKQLQAIRQENQPYPIDDKSFIEFLLPKSGQWKKGLTGAKAKIQSSKFGLIGAKIKSEIKNQEEEKSVVLKEFLCKICPRQYMRQKDLNKHMRLHHGEEWQ